MTYVALSLYLLGMVQTELALTSYEADKYTKYDEFAKAWIRLIILLLWPIFSLTVAILIVARAIVRRTTKE